MDKQKCKYCGKEIEGFSPRHVESLMAQHILAKHQEKINYGD